MFPTKESEQNKNRTKSNKVDATKAFESLDQFSAWLDTELEDLVNQFADFETDKSVRKYFKRS